jgi:hypothetical protein
VSELQVAENGRISPNLVLVAGIGEVVMRMLLEPSSRGEEEETASEQRAG